MSNNQTPLFTIRDGALKATVWENQTNDGKAFHSVSLGRTFTDGEGLVKSASSFTGGDILKIARLAGKAYDRIAELRLESSQQREAA